MLSMRAEERSWSKWKWTAVLTTEDQAGLPKPAYIIHTPPCPCKWNKSCKKQYFLILTMCGIFYCLFCSVSFFKASCNPPKWFQDPMVCQNLSIKTSKLYPKTTNQTEHKSAALTYPWSPLVRTNSSERQHTHDLYILILSNNFYQVLHHASETQIPTDTTTTRE